MAQVIQGEVKDLGGFSVTRILPNSSKAMVGPFIFIDHMGPAHFAAGEGIDVRPHPHIGLATITYMLEGGLLHRDSLGNCVEIVPGDINWMTAGRGIVHSERETIEVKSGPHALNGIQCWLALPEEKAEIAPSFTHVKKSRLPHFMRDGVLMRLIAGDAYGMASPVKTYSPMFYLDILLKAGKTIERPNRAQECAVYVINGGITLGAGRYGQGTFVLLNEEHSISSLENSRLLLFGGEAWDKTPHLFWNFVAFSEERMEQAKDDWRESRFPVIPGDCDEYTPLPED